MKKFCCYSALACLLIGLAVTTSKADVIRFTATGAQGQSYSGADFGYVEYDHPTFLTQITGATQGNAVGVQNSYITGLSFQDLQSPYTSFTTGEVDPQQYGAVFMRDANNAPILWEGEGWLVQQTDGIYTLSGINTNGIQLSFRWGGGAGRDPYDHTYWVNWTTSSVAPEPATISLMGLGGLALLRRRKR